jgi:hypothetical protein
MSALVIPDLPDRVDELERLMAELRERPEDTMGTTNDFFINAGGQVQAPGGEGISTFTDTFTTAESYGNYTYPFTFQAELETNSAPTPAGLHITKAMGEPQQLFMLYNGFKDAAGVNRCIDHISILKYTTASPAAGARRIGNLCRFRNGEGAFLAWHSRTEGLAAFLEYESVKTIVYYWKKAKEQALKEYGAKAGFKINWPVTIWLMSCCMNQEVTTSLWTVDPFLGGAGPVVEAITSQANLPPESAESKISGLLNGTPTDVGIGLIGPGPGDVINEWTIVPLSWR